jgi:ankyrin repeat protein
MPRVENTALQFKPHRPKGFEAVVKILLNAGADVHALLGGLYGTALELASYHNHEEIVKILQEATRGLLPKDSSS